MSIVGKMVRAVVVLAMCALQETSGFTQGTAAPARDGFAAALTSSPDLIFVEAPVVLAGQPIREFPRGSKLARLHLDAAGRAQQIPFVLATEFFAVSHPTVSFDGRNLLFAAQTLRGGTWQIFEATTDGGSVRQSTHCLADCIQPRYLPEGFIAYTAMDGRGNEGSSQIQVARIDGSNAHAITFGPGNFALETVLHSGRLLLSANAPLAPGNGHLQPRALYLVDPDGCGLGLLRQDETSPAALDSAEELADGTILFVQQGTGALLRLRPGALHAVTIAGARSGYGSSHPLNEATLVASRRTIDQQLDLYLLPLDSPGQPQLLYRSSRGSSVQAVAIAPHPPVQAYRSILHPDRNVGRIVCLDASASKDVASGHLAAPIARVRFLARQGAGEKVLGEAPVEKDGSFYAAVPADLPIRLMLISANGTILKQQRSWMWVRPGEDRGCFGCHESQAQSPQNRSPMTLQRMDTPTLLTGAPTTAGPSTAARP